MTREGAVWSRLAPTGFHSETGAPAPSNSQHRGPEDLATRQWSGLCGPNEVLHGAYGEHVSPTTTPRSGWALSNCEGPACPQKSHGKSGVESGIRAVSLSHNFLDGLMDESSDLLLRTTVPVLLWPHEEDTLPPS